MSHNTVSNYLTRLCAVGLSWPLPEDLSESALERRLYPPPPGRQARKRGVPDWEQIHKELRRKGTTLLLLWYEYRDQNPEGYEYSWFCRHYRKWAGKPDLVMRQDHKLFVVRQANWWNVAGGSPAGRKGNAATFPPESWVVIRENND